MIVGTTSGAGLRLRAHQSIASPLIGMSQDGLAAFVRLADELPSAMGQNNHLQKMAKGPMS
jgi:pyruvate dehydrogenase E1 component